MKLNLSVAGKTVASVPLNTFEANNEYYLKAFRRLLLIRHTNAAKAVKNDLSFFVERPVEKRLMLAK